MAHILHLAPVGTDKASVVLSRLRETIQSQPDALPTVWALLATRRQQLNFRQRLTDLDEDVPAYFNIEFFNFYSLNARLLKIAGEPVRRLKPLTRLGLLRRLLAQMAAEDQLPYFHRIADTRGFAAILAELIDELKGARVDVADFAAAARSEKDREIAKIYKRYQALLRRSDLADVEGEGWLALAKTRERRDIVSQVDLLLVDGYDQFTLVQGQMLAALSQAIQNVHITLTALPDARAQTLPQRSRLARNRLQQCFADAQLDLTVETVAPHSGERQRDLERLGQNIFRESSSETSGDSIQLIEMPNTAEEVKSVLRKLRRQLLDGVKPDDILVALRDWDRYAAYFESGRDEFDLPLLLHYERPLHTAPVIAILIDLLGLAPRFRRRELLDALRSPYIDAGFDAEHIDLLDQLSKAQHFLGGAGDAWLEMVQLAGGALPVERDDIQRMPIAAEQKDELIARLSAFFNGLKPLDQATVPAYVDWLENLLGADPLSDDYDREPPKAGHHYSLNIIERARRTEGVSAAIVRRDITALHGLKRILHELMASDEVLRATFEGAPPGDWHRWRRDLKHALETTAAEPQDRSRNGQVLITTATEARGLPHRHVYILGLAEGVFPAEVSEEPLYFDSEREKMQTRGVPMATQSERVDDQGLFYELISLPQETLTLSRPTFQAGKVWNASHLWRAVRSVFHDLPIKKGAVGAVVLPADAASGAELLLAIAAHQCSSDPLKRESALRIKAWMQQQAGYAASWRRIARGRRLESGRLSTSPFDRYSGILSRPYLLRNIARRLGDNRVWSATQLNDYGHCGFRFFAKRLLKLEEIEEPEAGFDAATLGLLNHSILEETYREINNQALSIDEDRLQAALDIFAEVAADLLERAPERFEFRAAATWQEEKQVLRNRLIALVKQDFSPKSPLNRFGKQRKVEALELAFKDVEIDLIEGMNPLRVAGYIDRIEQIDGKLVLVDYKSGTRPIERRQMEIGRDFQMMVYVLALNRLLAQAGADQEVAGGLFWHVRNLKASGVYSADDEDDRTAIEAARQHLALHVKQGRQGQFPVQATELDSGKCARYCEYSHLCRMHVTSRFKALPGGGSD